nr:MAG TPA: hypothetical protein [Caudoviricetes sp.]
MHPTTPLPIKEGCRGVYVAFYFRGRRKKLNMTSVTDLIPL